MRSPFAIAVSPTGARRTRADHLKLPLTSKEIAQAAARCLEAGACMLHLHVRKADGSHSLEAEDYRSTIDAVRQSVGQRMVIQITTEAAGIYSPARQIDLVKSLNPEAVSIALSEIVPGDDAVRPTAELCAWMYAEHVIPQFIFYSSTDMERYFELCKRGVIPDRRHWVLFVLGRHDSTSASAPGEILPFLNAWGDSSIRWAVCAFGGNEAACASAALTLGGHARVGFENNLHLPDGSLAPDNTDLVRVPAEIAGKLGCALADADTMRGWFD